MYDYRHILFPVDFSAQVEKIGSQVVKLARESGARVTLLHVIAGFPEDIPNDWIAPEDQPPREYLENRCQRELQRLQAKLGLEGAAQACILTEHSARSAILEFARSHDVDLIVMGAHGRSHGRLGALIGSTTNGVVSGATQDVLVVRPDAA
ncbi:MAG TPA: universal stress protein [Sedimenticola sp.]|nr:universal stress protein [Sedimenticola sp.]